MAAEPMPDLPRRRPTRKMVRAVFGLVFVVGVFVVAPLVAMFLATV
jgi:hypothetical protein